MLFGKFHIGGLETLTALTAIICIPSKNHWYFYPHMAWCDCDGAAATCYCYVVLLLCSVGRKLILSQRYKPHWYTVYISPRPPPYFRVWVDFFNQVYTDTPNDGNSSSCGLLERASAIKSMKQNKNTNYINTGCIVCLFFYISVLLVM